ncbi:MFS transporter [Hyphomonas sp. WL0036]|uniref:MFS transporter n=1 Tax=Hyphomonas sediminis TaxID=2866160 RepID=UPI001C7EF5E7|nr:MFS transporter [Hyphomonas sediminis]MBY9065711.1 MFS transporter [Hyphomonas sediminis]
MTDTRSVLALILSVMILQLAGGLTGILTPLGLERLGVDASLIGFVAAMNAAGFMLGAWTAPRALALAGNIRLFAAGAGVSAAGILSLSLIQEPPFWALIRVLQGISFAYMFTSIESWLGEAVPARTRGNVMGVYHTASKLSLIVGPFFLAGLSPLDSRSYVWAGIFLALALVPTCLTTLKEPPPPDRKSMPLSQLFDIAPAAVVGVIGAGLVNTGTLALLPVYFEKFDLAGGGTAAAAIAVAIAWLGGLIVQWPAGRVSDAIDRRLVIAGLTSVAGAAAILIAVFGQVMPEAGVLALIGLWGAGALCFYGVCVSHAIDRTPPGQVPQVMSGLLFVWAAGSIAGPLISGLAMRLAGALGLFGFAGIVLGLLAAYMIVRVRQRAPAEPLTAGERGPILPSPLASAEIVPRDPTEGEES